MAPFPLVESTVRRQRLPRFGPPLAQFRDPALHSLKPQVRSRIQKEGKPNCYAHRIIRKKPPTSEDNSQDHLQPRSNAFHNAKPPPFLSPSVAGASQNAT